MLDGKTSDGAQGWAGQRPIHCDECTIQIGDGYQESIPFEFVDDSTPRARVLQVCYRCWESLNRRKKRRAAEEAAQTGAQTRHH